MSPYPGRGYLPTARQLSRPSFALSPVSAASVSMGRAAGGPGSSLARFILNPARSLKLSTFNGVGVVKASGPSARNALGATALVIAGAALAATTIVSALSGKLYSVTATRLALAERDHNDLRWLIGDTTRKQQAEIQAIQAQMDEIKSPPTRFAEAQDLFSSGRYADAEAAYGRFLVDSPSSRVADVALYNSALANTMLGNCSMALSRFHVIRIRFPNSPYVRKEAQVAASCKQIRGSPAAALSSQGP